jgi:hypothetical protein
VGRKRLTKIHQILLVKIAKLGEGKWENEFASGLAQVVIIEGGRWVVVVVGRELWLEISQVIPGAYRQMRRG